MGLIPPHTPSGTVICPCGHTEYGVTDINRHAKMGITMMLKKCYKCKYLKPYKNSNKWNIHGCCSPVKTIEDDHSLRTKKWWDKVVANKGRIPE